VTGSATVGEVKTRVEALGYGFAVPLKRKKSAPDTQTERPAPKSVTPSPEPQGGLLRYLFFGENGRLSETGLGASLMLFALFLALFPTPQLVIDLLCLAALVIAGRPVAMSGINALRLSRELNINTLMTIAAVGAVIIQQYAEAAVVMVLFSVGEALEGYTADRARNSLRALLDLTPPDALLLHDGKSVSVPAASLQIDDVVLVQPGQRIPADGVILTGAGGVNQAPITGESMPIAKTVGEMVYAGTINGDAALTVRVTADSDDTTLARMVRLIEDSQRDRAPAQRAIDQFAKWYTPAIVLLATAVALIPPLVWGAPFFNTPEASGWLYRALALLVIACPCALVISAPITVISGITAAARRGVLIKGGAHLEALAQVKGIAFDKTGTLTRGEPTVLASRAAGCPTPDCAECSDVLAVAAALEGQSAHPLAQAVVRAAESRGLAHAYPPAQQVEQIAGLGVRGVMNEREITVGAHRLFDADYPHDAGLCAEINEAEAAGQTAVLLADNGAVRGYLTLADTVRPESAEVVRQLHALGLQTVMLTGDNPAAAQAIANQVGVNQVRASLLPADKVSAVQALTDQIGALAMVGDGVNDAPALAAASVGIAVGGAASAQAMETADIVLMADGLKGLPAALGIARFTRQLIFQNAILALAIKMVFVALAIEGSGSLWAAVFADVGVALLVAFNGMRPLRATNTESLAGSSLG
jgi:Cd2+/Zn2+-exporting ATPase